MTERPLTAYLVRHARSVGNSSGRVQGWLDLPLDDLGRRQAERLADRFRGWRFDALYSSPLARAADTARAVAAVTGTDIHYDPRLREYNMGAFTGMTGEEIQSFLSGSGLSPRDEYEWVARRQAPETYDRTRASVGTWCGAIPARPSWSCRMRALGAMIS
jgi:broad specificity phosphatase PhoE